MKECTVCGMTLADCTERLTRTGEVCCPWDDHEMDPVATPLTRLEQVEARLVELEDLQTKYAQHAAATVIWRTEIAASTLALKARTEGWEELRAINEGLRERLADREALLAEVHTALQGIPMRVDVIERCLVEIEAKLGLRRKKRPAQKALPPGPSK
jgi:DNA repair ATPase RecN